MEVFDTRCNDISILLLKDSLINSVYAVAINERINTLLKTSNTKIILNFSNMKNISSIGIHLLVRIKNKLEEKGGWLALINVNEHISGLLRVSNLANYLNLFNTEEEVIEKLNKKRANN